MVIVLNNDQFARNLRARRQKLRLSQKALAKQCGISVYRLRYMERGRIRDLEDVWMQALCDALGCSAGDFCIR